MSAVKIPIRMSLIIGELVIKIQDLMPPKIRNSDEWKQLLPLAADTGRKNERQRLNIILDWMWTDVLTKIQPLADEKGFGTQWRAAVDSKNHHSMYDLDQKHSDTIEHIIGSIFYANSRVSELNYLNSVRLTKKRARSAIEAILVVAIHVAAYGRVIDPFDAEYQKKWLSFDLPGLLNRLIEA